MTGSAQSDWLAAINRFVQADPGVTALPGETAPDALMRTFDEIRDQRDAARAERQRLSAGLRDLAEWAGSQRGYCRPPELETAPAEEVDRRRGPCAAYGAVVYGFVVARAMAALRDAAAIGGDDA